MKYLYTVLTIIVLTFSVGAQNDDRRERIKTLKIAFLTERLSLTETEAEKFWPLYNTFEETNHELRREMKSSRKELDMASLTEPEAKKLIADHLEKERKKAALKESFVKDLLRILPAKKVIQLRLAEDAFNKRMLEQFRKRRSKRP